MVSWIHVVHQLKNNLLKSSLLLYILLQKQNKERKWQRQQRQRKINNLKLWKNLTLQIFDCSLWVSESGMNIKSRFCFIKIDKVEPSFFGFPFLNQTFLDNSPKPTCQPFTEMTLFKYMSLENPAPSGTSLDCLSECLFDWWKLLLMVFPISRVYIRLNYFCRSTQDTAQLRFEYKIQSQP